ncbi:MAG: hypothetical protein IKU68_08635 [Oscillospiraceae bacterium]|nr:hypothetical protein [Oscillospiraceae bacterium]
MDMKLGTITGNVQISRQADGFAEEKILMVEMEGSTVAALDRAGAKPGDRVIVVMDHAASRYSMAAPVDAVITAVVLQGE